MELAATIAYVLALLGSLLYLALLFWMGRGWKKSKLPFPEPACYPPLSVVMAAHNEATHLRRFLPSILSQPYPDFEVVVALDRCDDESEVVLSELAGKVSVPLRWIRITETPAGWAPKKWALSQAIEGSRHDCLALTDADCAAEPQWLQGIGRAFATGKEVVLGVGKYYAYPGWLNRFIRFETFYAALQYIGLAGQGHPYMGVGRNLAYRKEVYERAGGFSAIRSSLSGDDDLFVNAYAQSQATANMIAPQTVTYSEPERNFGSWKRQKVRHISASANYRLKSKLLLGSFHLAHMASWGGLLLFWTMNGNFWAGLFLFAGRMMGSWYIFGKVNEVFRERNLLSWFPILDFLFFVYNLSMVPLGLIAKPEWKRRNLKYRKTPSKTESW
jgi:cellulose synthase/poly-beta-1,6-N-acetylglucosamine synthase-like glycosyltransferase